MAFTAKGVKAGQRGPGVREQSRLASKALGSGSCQGGSARSWGPEAAGDTFLSAGAQPCSLELGPLASRAVGGHVPVAQAAQFVVLCHGCPKKLTQRGGQ